MLIIFVLLAELAKVKLQSYCKIMIFLKKSGTLQKTNTKSNFEVINLLEILMQTIIKFKFSHNYKIWLSVMEMGVYRRDFDRTE